MQKAIKIIVGILIIFNLYLCAYSVLHNDIAYHTDIARDFLLLQDVTDTHKLPLIGPRTGGIDGLFHGPLWTWLNLPAFVIGNGNPVVIGWFWMMLVLTSIGITFFVAEKVFNRMVGLLSALILSVAWVMYSNSLYNPSGALIFAPLFFYFFYQYVQTLRARYLALAFLILGILIQFEVAFGGPLLLLSLFYLAIFLFKKKKLKHILTLFVLIIPLSTYIVFDIRHDFLQLNSILNSVGKATGSGSLEFSEILQNRFDGAIKSLFLIPNIPTWFSVSILALFGYLGFKAYKDKKSKTKNFILLFIYFYIGFWPISFYLNGHVLDFHVLPYLPVAIIILAASYQLIRKEVFIVFLIGALFFNYTNAKAKIDKFNTESGVSAGSWLFNQQLTNNMFNTAPKEFGYYVFTPDEWGYGPKYAITYTKKNYPEISAVSNNKKASTYLIMAPPLEKVEGNREWWVKNRVKISNSPVNVVNYKNGYKVQKYTLTPEEIKIPSDPNLVDGLFFR